MIPDNYYPLNTSIGPTDPNPDSMPCPDYSGPEVNNFIDIGDYECYCMSLNGDTSFSFKVHIIQNLVQICFVQIRHYHHLLQRSILH